MIKRVSGSRDEMVTIGKERRNIIVELGKIAQIAIVMVRGNEIFAQLSYNSICP